MDFKKEITKLFTPDKSKKEKAKIFVGNGRLSEMNSSITIDVTQLAKYPEYFKEITVDGEIHYEVEVTILPFQKGINKFGNSHYLIIKNK